MALVQPGPRLYEMGVVVIFLVKAFFLLTFVNCPNTGKEVDVQGNYSRAFVFVVGMEGYKSDDPNDPGGRTIWGISEKHHPEVVAKIWDMPADKAKKEAEKFYRAEYWNAVRGDDLPDGHDIMAFDAAVNQGPGFARSIVGLPLILQVAARMERYANSATWQHHGRGWIRRLLYLIREVSR